MKVEQIYTECLSEAAYYLESNGEAAVVDPLRDVVPYLSRAAESGARIRYVLVTHFHADFVSGHLELAKKTGATIVFGPTAMPGYAAYIAQDQELLPLGNVRLKVLHTPGHTMESTSFLLMDEEGDNHAVFTGDTLFIGEVGRPDMEQCTSQTLEEMTAYLYDSLRSQLMTLPDEVIVYPGHGICPAWRRDEEVKTIDTLGHQKRCNAGLRESMSREEFATYLSRRKLKASPHLAKAAMINRQGYASMDSILARGLTALSPGAVGEIVKHQEVLLLDTRPSPSFVRSFVPGSIWVGFGSTFDSWVSRLVMDSGQPLVIVADRGSEEGVISRLAGIGFDQVLGYLNGGLEAWADAGLATGSLMEVSPEVFSEISDPPTVTMLDVRSSAEYFCQHIEGARHFPVEAIECQPDELDRDEAYFLYSQHGDRSTLAASLMLRQGFTQLVHVQGGFTEVKKWIQGVTPYREPLLMW